MSKASEAMGLERSNYVIRGGVGGDVGFVMQTWLRSAQKDFPLCLVPRDLFYASHGKLVEGAVGRSVVLVAASPEDADLIMGWACVEQGVLHFVYVKGSLRGFGLGRALLDAGGIDTTKAMTVSHLNAWTRKLAARGVRIEYDPYSLYEGQERHAGREAQSDRRGSEGAPREQSD